MPKDLTDLNTWATIAVPVGTDPATAASVETPLQLLTNRTRHLYESLISARASNWKAADFTAVAAQWTSYTPRDICYDASLGGFTALNSNGGTIYTYHPNTFVSPPALGGGGGIIWEDEASTPFSVGGWGGQEIASDQNGQRVVVDPGSANVVIESSGLSTWASRSATGTWYCIDHDKQGVYAIGGASGTISTSTNGTAWTARTSGCSNQIICIAHNYSTVSPRWVALTSTECSLSTTGVTWSAIAHSLSASPVPHTLRYSAYEDKWMVILTNCNIGYSTDGGLTWSEYSDPFGLYASYNPLSGDKVAFESDGQGGWIFQHNSPGAGTDTDRRWVSKNNGVDWYEVPEGITTKTKLCWGDDHFISVGDLSAHYSIKLNMLQ